MLISLLIMYRKNLAMTKFYKTTFAVILSFFIFLQTTRAQTIFNKKDKSYGGSRSDNATSIKKVENGNYLVSGQTISNDSQITGFHGGLGFFSDFWIIKINSTGKLLWQKTLGGVKEDVPFDIALSADGGYVIAGETGSVDGDVTNNHGQTDFWVVKLSTVGTLMWAHTYGGIRDDAAHSIIATADDGFIVVGKLRSPDGSNTNFWVIKINGNGIMLWQKIYGNIFNDEAYAISPTADGGFIVAGKTQSIDGINYNGFTDYMVVKADNNGNMQWQKAYGGTMRDEAHSVYQTADGGYVIGGFTESIDKQVTNNHASFDIWIIKVNSTGVLQWQKTLGCSDIDWTFDVIPAADGGIIVSGDVSSTDGDIKGNHSGSDMWVAKLNNTGKVLTSISLGGSSSDGARSIIPVTSGYIVAGYANSNDGNVSKYFGGSDFWIVKLDQTLSQKNIIAANITKQTDNQLKIYPNPSAGNFRLTLPDAIAKSAVTITNSSDHIIYRNTFSDNQTSHQISVDKKVIDGIYTVTVISNEKIIRQQLIIQN